MTVGQGVAITTSLTWLLCSSSTTLSPRCAARTQKLTVGGEEHCDEKIFMFTADCDRSPNPENNVDRDISKEGPAVTLG